MTDPTPVTEDGDVIGLPPNPPGPPTPPPLPPVPRTIVIPPVITEHGEDDPADL